MESMILSLFELSFGASMMILLMVLLIPLAGKKFSAKWRYWLWLLLAIRLLCPFSVNVEVPLMRMELPAELLETQQIVIEAPPISVTTTESQTEHTTAAQNTATNSQEDSYHTWNVSILELLAYIWLVGTVGIALWQLRSYVVCRRKLSLWNQDLQDETAEIICEELRREMKIVRCPILMKNRRNTSPMLIGFTKPMLILPEMDYSEEEYRVILRHELYHYKRHDLWYKLLLLTARCVHWFNPLAYIMLREAENDLEITCDEVVVERLSKEEKADYCETILRILSKGSSYHTVLSTGFNSGKKVLQRRFESVLNEKTGKSIVLAVLCTVLMLFLCGFVQVDVETKQPTNTFEEESATAAYLAIPEEQRPIQQTEMVMVEPILPLNQTVEFWEKKAQKFFWFGFELKDHLTPQKLGEFIDMVASDMQLYYTGGIHGGILIPYSEIRAILYAHLPAQAIQPEGSIRDCNHDFICSKLPRDIALHSLNYVQMFNEEGNKLFPYNEISDTYTLVFKELLNQYDTKVMETVSKKVYEVEPGVKRFSFELVAYEKDKYYSESQEKVVLETYRFSVKVAEDSWFIEEAIITKSE